MTTDEGLPVTAKGSWRDKLVTALFALLLLTPGALFAVGVRPAAIEGRELAARPDLTLGSLLSGQYFAGLDAYLSDNFPLRTRAVSLHSWLDYSVLHGSPTNDVAVGEGDWLFFRGEFREECPVAATDILKQITQLTTSLGDRGIRFMYVMAPDKHAIYPDKLPAVLRDDPACNDHQRPIFRAGIPDRTDATVDLWSVLEDHRGAHPADELYFHQDSHWTPVAVRDALRSMIGALDPSVWREGEAAVAGSMVRQTDLSRLMGRPAAESVPQIAARPGVRLRRTTLADKSVTRSANTVELIETMGTTDVVPGTTLIVYDSFFGNYQAQIASWFERSVWIHITDLRAHPELVKLLPAVNTVIAQTVEREAYGRSYIRLLQPLLDRTTPG